jgi:hypothetical protein
MAAISTTSRTHGSGSTLRLRTRYFRECGVPDSQRGGPTDIQDRPCRGRGGRIGTCGRTAGPPHRAISAPANACRRNPLHGGTHLSPVRVAAIGCAEWLGMAPDGRSCLWWTHPPRRTRQGDRDDGGRGETASQQPPAAAHAGCTCTITVRILFLPRTGVVARRKWTADKIWWPSDGIRALGENYAGTVI